MFEHEMQTPVPVNGNINPEQVRRSNEVMAEMQTEEQTQVQSKPSVSPIDAVLTQVEAVMALAKVVRDMDPEVAKAALWQILSALEGLPPIIRSGVTIRPRPERSVDLDAIVPDPDDEAPNMHAPLPMHHELQDASLSPAAIAQRERRARERAEAADRNSKRLAALAKARAVKAAKHAAAREG